MLKVTIDQKQAQQAETRNGTKHGRDWSITTQPIWLFQCESPFPIQINFILPDGVSHYESGDYELDIESAIDQGSFKSLVLDTRKLFLVKKNLGTVNPMGKQVSK